MERKRLRNPKELSPASIWNTRTFVEPQQPGKVPSVPEKNNWSRVANGLAALQPGLLNFLDTRHQTWTEEQMASARDAYERNKMDWKKLIDKNPEYRDASPHFRREYHASHLRNNVREFHQNILQELATNPSLQMQDAEGNIVEQNLLESDDPSIVQDWLSQRYDEFRENIPQTMDPILVNDNLERLETIKEQVMTYHTDARVEAYRQGVKQGLYKDTVSSIVDVFQDGGPATTEDALEMGAYLKDVADRYITSGLFKHEVNSIMADSIVKYAEQTMNTEMLDILDKIPTGTGYLGNVPEVNAAVNLARGRIDERKWVQQNREHTIQQREAQQYSDRTMSAALLSLLDGDMDNSEELYRDLLKNDEWRNAQNLRATIDSYMEAQKAPSSWDDHFGQISILDDFYMNDFSVGEKRDTLMRSIQNGDIMPETGLRMLKDVYSDAEALRARNIGVITEKANYFSTSYLQHLESMMTWDGSVTNEEMAEARAKVTQFRNSIERMTLDWVNQNRKNNPTWEPTHVEALDAYEEFSRKLLNTREFAFLDEDLRSVNIEQPSSAAVVDQARQLDQQVQETVEQATQRYNDTNTELQSRDNLPNYTEEYIPELGVEVYQDESGEYVVDFQADDAVMHAWAETLGVDIPQLIQSQAFLHSQQHQQQEQAEEEYVYESDVGTLSRALENYLRNSENESSYTEGWSEDNRTELLNLSDEQKQAFIDFMRGVVPNRGLVGEQIPELWERFKEWAGNRYN